MKKILLIKKLSKFKVGSSYCFLSDAEAEKAANISIRHTIEELIDVKKEMESYMENPNYGSTDAYIKCIQIVYSKILELSELKKIKK